MLCGSSAGEVYWKMEVCQKEEVESEASRSVGLSGCSVPWMSFTAVPLLVR